MSFLDLCDDPLVKTLQEVFGTTIIRVPEERIRPLTVVASDGRRSSFRGELAPLLINASSFNVPMSTSQMADVSGKRSRKVSIDLGLKILEGFLKGFGVPAAGITVKLEGASEVSFSFKGVNRIFVDINVLGRALTSRQIDLQNPAASIFSQAGTYTFLVIDSVIASSDFSISVDKTSSQGFKLDVPAIQTIVSQANAEVKVSTTSGYDLVFQGNKLLAFAFSCVRLYLDENGTITAMPPEADVPALSRKLRDIQKPDHVIIYSPDRVILRTKPGLLSWD